MEQYYSLVVSSFNYKFQRLFGEHRALDDKTLDEVVTLIKYYHTQKNLLIWDINIFSIVDDPDYYGGIYYTITVQTTKSKDNPEDTVSIHDRNLYLYEIAEKLTKNKVSNISIKDIVPEVAQLTFKVSNHNVKI